MDEEREGGLRDTYEVRNLVRMGMPEEERSGQKKRNGLGKK